MTTRNKRNIPKNLIDNLEYRDGGLYFRSSPRYGIQAGERADKLHGSIKYRTVKFKGTRYLAHRIIWEIVHGTIQDLTLEIDHINRDKLDNNINNLRLVSKRINTANKEKPAVLTGVYLLKHGKWVARITVNYKKIHLGVFETKEEANLAYTSALHKLEEVK